MHSFIVCANAEFQRETDTLCEDIERHYDSLRAGALGKRFRLSSSACRQVALNRNAIYRLQSGSHAWFLKLPVGERSDMVARESLGARTLCDALPDQPHYLRPSLIRVSETPGYVLTSELPGRYLTSSLYRSILSVRGAAAREVSRGGFHSLGRVLGRVHNIGPVAEVLPSTSMPAYDKMRKAFDRLERPDSLCASIEDWAERFRPDPDRCFVHGNLRRENIFFHRRRVGLIDFETCGTGSRYDDLSLICSNLALARAAACFPWSRVYAAWAALLDGYRQEYRYEHTTFWSYMLLQLAASYAWKLAGRSVTVARVPVSRKKLESLIRGILEADIASAFPGVGRDDPES